MHVAGLLDSTDVVRRYELLHFVEQLVVWIAEFIQLRLLIKLKVHLTIALLSILNVVQHVIGKIHDWIVSDSGLEKVRLLEDRCKSCQTARLTMTNNAKTLRQLFFLDKNSGVNEVTDMRQLSLSSAFRKPVLVKVIGSA